ncbi:hypothetical protein EPK84_21745 [Sinorhizobium fredii]|nr:hypothetical protein EPK84_21745 [Sinorhizobium fredii]
MAMLGLISFCLVFLLGSSAGGQAATADRLAPQGMREMRASEWHALIRSIADTARRNDMIAIGTMATLDLPGAGRLLGAAQGQREAMKPPFGQTADSVGRGEAAEASVKKTGALTGREGARSAAPEEKLLAASQEVDAPNGVQLAGGKLEEILRRALLAARRDLEAMRRVAEKQRQRAEALARDLTMVLEVVEELEAKAAGAMRSKAAALRARDAAEKTLAGERRALEEARHRLGALERDLAVARQSSKVPGPDADLAAAEKAAEVRARQTAEAAARRAGEELALEREKVKSLARELDTVRGEREAAMKDGGDPAVAPPAAILEPDADLAAENAAAVRARQTAEAAARRAVEELALEREKVKSLARELDTVRREREAAVKEGRDHAVAPSAAALEPDADLAAAEKAAVVLDGQIAAAAARRAGEELALEREKVKLLARELDTVRREREAAVEEGGDLAVAPSAAVLEPDADLAAAEKAAVLLAGQIAEAASKRAGEELALEREKVKSLARDLDTVRQERDAAKKQLTGILAAQQRASEDAGDRAGGRGRAAPRKEVEIRKTRTERRAARVERAPQPLPEALLPRRLLPGLW